MKNTLFNKLKTISLCHFVISMCLSLAIILTIGITTKAYAQLAGDQEGFMEENNDIISQSDSNALRGVASDSTAQPTIPVDESSGDVESVGVDPMDRDPDDPQDDPQ